MSLKLYKSMDLTGSSCAGVIGELSGCIWRASAWRVCRNSDRCWFWQKRPLWLGRKSGSKGC